MQLSELYSKFNTLKFNPPAGFQGTAMINQIRQRSVQNRRAKVSESQAADAIAAARDKPKQQKKKVPPLKLPVDKNFDDLKSSVRQDTRRKDNFFTSSFIPMPLQETKRSHSHKKSPKPAPAPAAVTTPPQTKQDDIKVIPLSK